MNLINNSLKFTKKGQVEVKVKWQWDCGISNGDCDTCMRTLKKSHEGSLLHKISKRRKRSLFSHQDSRSPILNSPHAFAFRRISIERERKRFGLHSFPHPSPALSSNISTERIGFGKVPEAIDCFMIEQIPEEDEFQHKLEKRIKTHLFQPNRSVLTNSHFKKKIINQNDSSIEDSFELSEFAFNKICKHQKRKLTVGKTISLGVQSKEFEEKKVEEEFKREFHQVDVGRKSIRSISTPRIAGKDSHSRIEEKDISAKSCSPKKLKRTHSDVKNDKDKNGFCGFLTQMPQDGHLIIQVSDTGCGISPQDKVNLFQPFSQANKSIHSKYGGTTNTLI
jgi:hypothetical protein